MTKRNTQTKSKKETKVTVVSALKARLVSNELYLNNIGNTTIGVEDNISPLIKELKDTMNETKDIKIILGRIEEV